MSIESRKLPVAEWPGNLLRKNPVPLQPHEIVGDLTYCYYTTKENIPSETRYKGMVVREHLSGEFIDYEWDGTTFIERVSSGFKEDALSVNSTSTMEVSVDQYVDVRINMVGDIQSLKFTDGVNGQRMNVAFTSQSTVDISQLRLAVSFSESSIYAQGDRVAHYLNDDQRTYAVYEAIGGVAAGTFNASEWRVVMVVDEGIRPFIKPGRSTITNYEAVCKVVSADHTIWKLFLISNDLF